MQKEPKLHRSHHSTSGSASAPVPLVLWPPVTEARGLHKRLAPQLEQGTIQVVAATLLAPAANMWPMKRTSECIAGNITA
eukprot:3750508-Amphidinium_carterae.1